MLKTTVTAPGAPVAGGPYSHAVVANGFAFTAGQVGTNPATGKLAEGGIQAQTAQALENVDAVLSAVGAGLEDVVKVTVFLANMDDFAAMNEVYARYFWRKPPARTTVQAARLPIGALLEIETIAVLKS
jgi:2-iminobutanoate/2-iminopropanoate deaminase